MPDIMDALKKACPDLYEKNATIVRTLDGKFELMPWQKVYNEMEQVSSYIVQYRWSFGIPGNVTVYRDKEGKVYAATGWSHVPSDYPHEPSPAKGIPCMPIYFEELTPEQAEKLIKEAFLKESRRELEIPFT